MSEPITFGLARMHLEYGERRDFLPSLVADMENRGAKVFLEYGYGSGLGYTEDDYKRVAPGVQFVSHQDIYRQQNVLVLRCPTNEELELLQPGTCLQARGKAGTENQQDREASALNKNCS